jgi:hypothetical protein
MALTALSHDAKPWLNNVVAMPRPWLNNVVAVILSLMVASNPGGLC